MLAVSYKKHSNWIDFQILLNHMSNNMKTERSQKIELKAQKIEKNNE